MAPFLSPARLLFLPGASGNTHFWAPVADLLAYRAPRVHAGWPGFGALGGQDWRASLLAANPALPDCFATERQDSSARLGEIRARLLLLWGDADPISPPAAGRRLASLLSGAELHFIPGGTHDFAIHFAGLVAPLIDAHLAAA